MGMRIVRQFLEFFEILTLFVFKKDRMALGSLPQELQQNLLSGSSPKKEIL